MSDSLIHAAAGAAGGSLAMAMTYPLIFLSTRAAVETKKTRKSFHEAVLDILQAEGLLGLYSGLTSSILGIAITNFVYYGFYEKSRDVIMRSRPGKGLSTGESILAGMIAGSATTIISNPIWVVQTSQAVQTMSVSDGPSSDSAPVKTRKMGIFETINYILQKDGVKAFFRGLGPALVLVINPIIQYTVFEQLKNRLVTRRTALLKAGGSARTAVLTDKDFFFLGAISKLGKSLFLIDCTDPSPWWGRDFEIPQLTDISSVTVATSTTYPYIVVKSRMQSGQAHALKYKSALDGIITIVRQEGVAGLYRGIESKLVQSVLTAAILFAGQRRIYEATKAALAKTAVKV